MKLGFIGGGQMAEAIIDAIITDQFIEPADITVGDISQERRIYLSETFSVNATVSNLEVIESSDMLVIAIKPQDVPILATEVSGLINPSCTIVSIVAGTRLDKLQTLFKHDLVVRVMPNTPAQVKMGMSVWIPTNDVSSKQKAIVASLLQSLGKEMEVEDEAQLDMSTALSGSGPAYFLLFLEHLIEAGTKIGLTESQATILAQQTLFGTSRLIELSDFSPSQLREKVTSPGGTTEQAIKAFNDFELSSIVEAAVTAAFEKSKNLG
ncbi:MAG: pyrroline-5-carboxylate reductase [Dehalococcoidia bacterium]